MLIANSQKIRAVNVLKEILLAAVLSASLLPISVNAETNEKTVCHFDGVDFDSQFPAGRMNQCEKIGNTKYVLTISPETSPGHHSPWYAFKVRSSNTKNITVYLKYSEQKHRYHPKTSKDGLHWEFMSQRKITLLDKGKRVKLNLEVGPNPLWIAGQEIVDNNHYRLWLDKLRQQSGVSVSVMGKSTDGRDVHKLEVLAGSHKKLIILTGRQHPAEVTGALAMMYFVERLLAKDVLASAFRKEFGILLVPNMNPDGVYHGHWRKNSNGVDLNRDWGPFTQAETKLVQLELETYQQKNAPRPYLFLDFHSTNRDIFYTQTDREKTTPPNFTPRWLAAIESRIRAHRKDYKVERQPGRSEKSAVAKSYMYRTFGIPAITYELGDNSNRVFIKAQAAVAAEEMMKLMLSYEG